MIELVPGVVLLTGESGFDLIASQSHLGRV
jgi:hypothetical protein